MSSEEGDLGEVDCPTEGGYPTEGEGSAETDSPDGQEPSRLNPDIPVCEQLDLTPATQVATVSVGRFRAVARSKGYRPGQPARRQSPLSASRRSEPWGQQRDPRTLGDTVAHLFHDRGWVHEVSVGGVIGRWRDVVGDQVADHCVPETFNDGVLIVRTDSSAWAQQLKVLAPQLVDRMAEDVGTGVVREVRVLGPAGPSFGRGKRSVKGRGPRDTWG